MCKPQYTLVFQRWLLLSLEQLQKKGLMCNCCILCEEFSQNTKQKKSFFLICFGFCVLRLSFYISKEITYSDKLGIFKVSYHVTSSIPQIWRYIHIFFLYNFPKNVYMLSIFTFLSEIMRKKNLFIFDICCGLCRSSQRLSENKHYLPNL